MTQALALSLRELGSVWPNPAVGCVLVKEDKIVGQGWTGRGGRPHAEAVALDMAGADAKGATAFVTLEPCAHEGATPSCASLLAKAGVGEVIYSISDPDPRTAGKGAEILRKAGIKVREGLGVKEASRIHQGFFSTQTLDRPMVTLKLAVSKDGKIAEKEGVRTQITGEQAFLFTQKLRAMYDAILVGIGTVLADDPSLTCRIEGLQNRSPVRIVLDKDLKISKKSALLKGAKKTPVWVVTEAEIIPFYLTKTGIEIVQVNDINNLTEVLEKIKEKGITRLLVEGGSKVATSFHKSGLLDHIYLFTNPDLVLGDDGVPAFRDQGILTGSKIKGFRTTATNPLGKDVVDVMEKKG